MNIANCYGSGDQRSIAQNTTVPKTIGLDEHKVRWKVACLTELFLMVQYYSNLVYDLLVLSKRLTELDVSTVLTILQCTSLYHISIVT
jgi:hypothetical protein